MDWHKFANILVERRIFTMKKFLMNEEGQGMVEYGLIIALVAVVVIAAIALLGNGVKNTFTNITNTLK
jgi:pilus assembly protein Flp/PilA